MKIDIKNLKQNVIIDIKNNIKIKTILNKYNLPKSTLYYWLKQGKDISDYYKKIYGLKQGDTVVLNWLTDEEHFELETPVNLKIVGF